MLGIMKKYNSLLSNALKFADSVIIISVGLFCYRLVFKSFQYFPTHYILAFILSVIVLNFLYFTFDLYEPLRSKSIWIIFLKLFLAWLSFAFLFFLAVFLTKTGSDFSRSWFAHFLFIGLLSTILLRAIIYFSLRRMRKKGLNQRRVMIIGEPVAAQNIIQEIKKELWTGYCVTTVINLSNEEDDVSQIATSVVHNNIDEVWIVLSFTKWVLIQKILQLLQHNVVTVRLIPELSSSQLLNFSATQVMGFMAFDLRRTPMFSGNRLVKAIEDRVFAFLIMIFISPILLILSVLVKISSKGPVFYKQKRVSWNGKEFNMLKFRSMPVNVESSSGAVWAKENDNRATKIGALLRKTSLDELPQFINVLKGDMSIVGPRPERPQFVEKFKHEIPNYMQKHLVKSGITGWAQVNGWRGNTCLKTRIQYDLYYIEHWSLSFDLKIIFLTIFKGFINKNAY